MWAGPSLSPRRCFDMDNGLMPDSFSLTLEQLTAMKHSATEGYVATAIHSQVIVRFTASSEAKMHKLWL